MSAAMTVWWHADVLTHDTGEGLFDSGPSPLIAVPERHPESAPRIANMKRALEAGAVGAHLEWRAGRHASDEEILRFHTPEHLALLEACDATGHHFSRTTLMTPGSMRAIRAAAGTALAAMHCVLEARSTMAHALVRPPGHHAAPAMVDGYCFLNNLAIACALAKARGIGRIAVIDWDVHHGNGTQTGFYERDDVLTISIHMDHGSWGPSHPETGGTEERGKGAGEGFNVNIPLPLGLGDNAYRLAFEDIVAPRVERFRPDLIVIANGQDANQFDPNGRQCVTVKGFHQLGTMARALALALTGGRLLSVQEGGYQSTYAALCCHAAIEGLLGLPLATPDPIAFLPDDLERAKSAVAAIASRLGTH